MSIVKKENVIGNKNPLFLRFLNKELSCSDILQVYSYSDDFFTADTAKRALKSPPMLEEFHAELQGAVYDAVKMGIGDEFKAFVNHYMESSLEEHEYSQSTPLGENKMWTAVIRDAEAPWIQGFVCYNLCLYIKAFGLSDLKICKTCDRIFAGRGRFAKFCDDDCKKNFK